MTSIVMPDGFAEPVPVPVPWPESAGLVVRARCEAPAGWHVPVFSPVGDGDWFGYGFPCPYCELSSAYEVHRGCRHARHRAWRRWRITGKVASWLYVTGITAGGQSVAYGSGCSGCVTMPRFNLNRRVYVLGVTVDHWRCLLRGRHWPGDPIGFGLCAKCCPCPECGSRTAEHAPGCAL